MTDQPFGTETYPQAPDPTPAPNAGATTSSSAESVPGTATPAEQTAPQLHDQVPEGAPGFLRDVLRQVEERLRKLGG